MRKVAVLAVAMIVMAFSAQAGSRGDFKIAFTDGDERQNSFYLAVGDYNRMPQRLVIMVRQQGIPDEDLPVVFFLASKSGVPYQEIINHRLKGWKWMKIVKFYHLDSSIFYVRINGNVKSRGYGKAYRNYNERPQNRWNRISLSDNEIVNMVNLRFVSEHYGYAPEVVIKMRDEGRDFVAINNDIYVEKVKKSKPVNKSVKRNNKKGR